MNTSLAEQLKHHPAANGQDPAPGEGLDRYEAEELDRIAKALWADVPDGDLDKETLSSIAATLEPRIWTMISVADWSTHLDFVQWELASGQCFLAWRNGKETSAKMMEAGQKLRDLERDCDGTEINDVQIQRQVTLVRGYESRLWFWRAYFKAATAVYARVAAGLRAGGGFDWIDSCWRSPDARTKSTRDRTVTAARAEARAVLARLSGT